MTFLFDGESTVLPLSPAPQCTMVYGVLLRYGVIGAIASSVVVVCRVLITFLLYCICLPPHAACPTVRYMSGINGFTGCHICGMICGTMPPHTAALPAFYTCPLTYSVPRALSSLLVPCDLWHISHTYCCFTCILHLSPDVQCPSCSIVPSSAV